MASFGERLKILREAREITQAELGKLLSFSKQTVSNYENSVSTPDFVTLKAIADYFSVTVDYLLGRTDEPRPGAPFVLPPFVGQLSPEMQAFLRREAAQGWPRLRLLYSAELKGLTPQQIEQVLGVLVDVKQKEGEAKPDRKS